MSHPWRMEVGVPRSQTPDPREGPVMMSLDAVSEEPQEGESRPRERLLT